jgi:hypothetical protein
LEKQKQELVSSFNQILNDPKIPINDKIPIIKELSRAIANITEQINKMTGSTPVPKEKNEEQRKEEFKQIKKEKKEMQPLGIPEKVETAK